MKELKQKAKSALIWDVSGTFFQNGVGFLISLVLARLLSPAQFGVVGITLVIINLMQVFIDFGFASALIQNKNNTSLTYSSVFYMNIAAGLLLVLLFQLLAPLIGHFYHSDRITELIRWLSLNIIFSSLNLVQRTILMRNINYKTLTVRAVTSQTIGGIIGIYLAFAGWGVYALVVQSLSATLIDVLILWRVAEWYPKLEFSWNEIKKLSGFSMYVFLTQVFNRFTSRLDVLVVGKAFSPVTVGFYSRADSLNSIATKYSSASLTKVFYPILSKLQDDDEKFQSVYFKLLHLIAFGSFLLTGIMIFAGPDIILVLFGKKWEPSIMIFQIMALKAFTAPISSLIINVFLAKGKSKENFWYGNVRKLMILPAFLFAFTLGLTAFLWALIGISYLGWIYNNYIVTRLLNISFKKQIKSVVPYLLIFVSGYFLIYFLFYNVQYFIFLGAIQSVVYLIYFIFVNFIFKTDSFTFILKNDTFSWLKLKNSLKKV